MCLGVIMWQSANSDFSGDFDENGQLVETPYRPSAAQRQAAAERKPAAIRQAKIETPISQDLGKPLVQPPMPGPLAKKPVPADLILDRSRDALLTAFGKATLTDRYLNPEAGSFQPRAAALAPPGRAANLGRR